MNLVSSFKDLSLPLFYAMEHDGEPDDIGALDVIRDSVKTENIFVSCAIGNPAIVHASATDKDEEMAARISLTNEVFQRVVAFPGARSKEETSEKYINEILAHSSDSKCLVVHTSSFKSLEDLAVRAKPDQLKNVTILSYGSVNLSWAMKGEQSLRNFYESISKSGATFLQVDAFPFLDIRNKLTHKNSPVTYALLSYFDGPAGKKWTTLNSSAAGSVRANQAKKIADYISRGLQKVTEEQKMTLLALVADIANLFERNVDENALGNSDYLKNILDNSLVGEKHDQLLIKLDALRKLLMPVLGESEDQVKRPFNIYAGVSLKGQALIADQIPAIIFSEFAENRTGIAKAAIPSTFKGMNGNFTLYATSSTKSSLYYLDTKRRVEDQFASRDTTHLSAEEIAEMKKTKVAKEIDRHLKYIDLCMATSFLTNSAMITPHTREQILSSDFKETYKDLAKTVKELGYDLPNSSQKILEN